ncbi:MAG: AmmeMemoRadiSam system radical SAM enzyme [Deltaproteobacteria bacterium]|nr:AmmeMemoRadiSam system radical SAM enzyme [Deltaproteobacteria bacterium]
MKEAVLYEKYKRNSVRCRLCSHRCTIEPSERGICGVRQNNKEGTLYSLVYGIVCATNIDPIEKKPLFHVYPGSRSFSIATVGCNFTCTFCQNHEISQMPKLTGKIAGRDVTPEEIVDACIHSGSQTIAYTYTEPTVYFEFALDTAKIAHEKGIKNVFVTNGYMTEEALETIEGYLDAANCDLKSFSDDFYKERCGARLKPVLNSLKKMKAMGVWLEVTTLLIPALNDGESELRQIAEFICSLGIDTPWHISRFHPQYKMLDVSPTPWESIERAFRIGKEIGLKYVYTGNVPGEAGENTHCANCGELLIERYGFFVRNNNLKNGTDCPTCGARLDGLLIS